MNEQDNPFKYRHAEQIVKEPLFLKLFGTQIIELIPSDSLMNKASIFVSTPGAGKSSLFRIFKPSSLKSIQKFHDNEDYSELFQNLQDRKILTETRVDLLGTYLSCARDYSDIELLDVPDKVKRSLFFSLMCSRIFLISLQGILELFDLTPNDLEKIHIDKPPNIETLPTSPFPCNGSELYSWASTIESEIYSLLNSYELKFDPKILVANNFDLLQTLNPENITIDSKKFIKHMLVMLDDVNFLTKNQHNHIYNVLKSHRAPLPFWIADRKESVNFEDVLPGNDGREFNIIEIERVFRQKGKKFELFAKNVANRRAKISRLDITDFASCLDNSLTSNDWNDFFKNISKKIRNKIDEKATFTKKFDNWIFDQEKFVGSERDKAIGWQALEICIERNITGKQQQLIDAPLETDQYSKSISAIKPAAEFFIHENEDVPYFFGFNRLSILANYNIEQFIELAGELFDAILSKHILKKSIILEPTEQENILQKIAKKYWSDIPRSYISGTNAFNLLNGFGNLAREQTIRPTAPYLPGVTGFALTTHEFFQVHDRNLQKQKPEYAILTEALQTLISNNLVYPEYWYKQGQKGSVTHVVFQLNRLLCVYFGLPLGYGGWRSVKPSLLCNWMQISKTGDIS